MAGLRAVLDTDILWPAYLRDTLLNLADPRLGLFEPVWSRRIIDDLGRTLLDRRRIDAAGWARLAAGLSQFPDALHEVSDELTAIMTNDPGDRHVLATAVAAAADFLVTRNLKDFPPEDCEPHGIEVLSPDDFLMALYRQAAEDVIDSLAQQVAGYRREPRTFLGLLDVLRASGLTQFPYTVQDENDADELEERVREYREALLDSD